MLREKFQIRFETNDRNDGNNKWQSVAFKYDKSHPSIWFLAIYIILNNSREKPLEREQIARNPGESILR